MIKAVVFDLDDTLYPEREYVRSGFRAVADMLEARGKAGAFDELDALFEKDREGVFDRYADSRGVDAKELVELYRTHAPDIKLFDDVLPALAELRDNGYKLGIITDGRPQGQRAKIAALGLETVVDKIIITDELGERYRKPSEKAFELMCEELCVSPDEMLYVGDNPKKDFAIKKSLPVKTVRVYRGGLYGAEPYADGIKEDESISSLAEISQAVAAIDGAKEEDKGRRAFVQSKLLEIMDFVHGVCEKESIEYSLSGGTMLGAVRHGGFIPWDDDMDIVMKRGEYERFCAVIGGHTDGTRFAFTTDSRVSTVAFAEPPVNCGMRYEGIRVDIFILDELPSGAKERKRLIFGLKKLQGMLHKQKIDWKHYSLKGKILLFGTKALGLFRSKKSLIRSYHKLAQKYDGQGGSRYFVSNDLFAVLGVAYDVEWFSRASERAFEDRRYYVFDGFDKILKERYGDYMTLPPIQNRTGVHTDVKITGEE